MTLTSLFIDNHNITAQDQGTFERRNPVSGQLASTGVCASPQDAVRAVEAASRAFPAWSATGPNERRSLLNKAADALEALRPALVQAMQSETGASTLWCEFNVSTAVGIVREAAALTTQIAGQVIPSDVPGNMALALRQPAGVVLGIAPWNAPAILGIRAIAVPLACGNTVVLKGSELCPATHRLLVDAFAHAGFAPGVVNYIIHAPENAGPVVQAMIAHKAVRRVNFTGSTKVGRIIALQCAEHLKPALLELGGKAPFVVLDDADLDQAAEAAAFGAFLHSGQICMSTERLVVDESVADAFAERLKAKARVLVAQTAGSPIAAVVDMSTVIRCNALIEDAVAKGATLLCGGKASSTLMAPTLLDHVTPDMRIYQEESFGPVKGIVRVRGADEAVRCANDNDYGLSAAVFGRDAARAMRVAQQIESGICHINGPTVHDEPQMHFGGVKHSGIGHFGGQSGIDAFTDLRWVTLQTTPRHFPF
ncbi:MAG: aldehyde dehydrogenase [Rhodoferax sp.]|uniref:aldehyde dehydrogenase n=1 Tax=Rhodoferax sp. TaxID=50421 RepID=UPI002ACEDE05|nr:aldehyde dehydrogenase [Rhodoferax sp.]MDZ7892796.1 aldehyde dehydrogenase [Rhodoferax sp.]